MIIMCIMFVISSQQIPAKANKLILSYHYYLWHSVLVNALVDDLLVLCYNIFCFSILLNMKYIQEFCTIVFKRSAVFC